MTMSIRLDQYSSWLAEILYVLFSKQFIACVFQFEPMYYNIKRITLQQIPEHASFCPEPTS